MVPKTAVSNRDSAISPNRREPVNVIWLLTVAKHVENVLAGKCDCQITSRKDYLNLN